MRQYFVYIMASYSRKTYVGVTNDLLRRVWQHKTDVNPGHTSQYRKHRLVHFEEYPRIDDAIAREKQLKGWDRQKKVNLIETENVGWEDLAADWYGDDRVRGSQHGGSS